MCFWWLLLWHRGLLYVVVCDVRELYVVVYGWYLNLTSVTYCSFVCLSRPGAVVDVLCHLFGLLICSVIVAFALLPLWNEFHVSYDGIFA